MALLVAAIQALYNSIRVKKSCKGGSPGLVVIGRDSCYKGHGFESRHHILDGHFFTSICCKVCLKRPKINEKRPELAHFLLKKVLHSSNVDTKWPSVTGLANFCQFGKIVYQF